MSNLFFYNIYVKTLEDSCTILSHDYKKIRGPMSLFKSRKYKEGEVDRLHQSVMILKSAIPHINVNDARRDTIVRTVEYLEPRVDKLFKKYCKQT